MDLIHLLPQSSRYKWRVFITLKLPKLHFYKQLNSQQPLVTTKQRPALQWTNARLFTPFRSSWSCCSSWTHTLPYTNASGYKSRTRHLHCDYTAPHRSVHLQLRRTGKVHRPRINSLSHVGSDVRSRGREREVGTGEGEIEGGEGILGQGAGRSCSPGCVLGGRLACLGLPCIRETGVLGNATKHT